MWEAVKPAWAAMSRKMGTGLVGLLVVRWIVADWTRADFFAAPGGAIFVAGALGFWLAACANSKLTANEIRLSVRAADMKCDCTASHCSFNPFSRTARTLGPRGHSFAADAHSQIQILPFDITGRNMLRLYTATSTAYYSPQPIYYMRDAEV